MTHRAFLTSGLVALAAVLASAPVSGTEPPAVLEGSADPCDGYDNDDDGAVDEQCDGVCDAPERAGPAVALSSASAAQPAMVWNGAGFGVAWQDTRHPNDEIYFARLDSAGNPIGPEIRITDTGDPGHESKDPTLAWSGTEYGLAWSDRRDGNLEIYFRRIDSAGQLVGGETRVTNAANDSDYPSLAWSGTEWGVVWKDLRNGTFDLYFARIDAAGTKIGADVPVTTGSTSDALPALIRAGSDYGLAWVGGPGGDNRIRFVRLDSAGARIGTETAVSDSTVSSRSSGVSLAWTGSGYGIAWDSQGTYFSRLDAAGVEPGADVLIAASGAGRPSPAWTGAEYGLAWPDGRHGSTEIYFARIDAAGSPVGAELRLAEELPGGTYPAAAWTGTGFHVVFEQGAVVYGSRVRCCDDADGDGYSECGGDSNDADPAVNPDADEVCDGQDNNSDGMVDEGCASPCDTLEKLTGDLRITFRPDIDATTGDLVWNGAGYGIVWNESAGNRKRIYFALLDAAGDPIGADVLIADEQDDYDPPTIVWTGAEYGLAWSADRGEGPGIWFTRLDPWGAPIGSEFRVNPGGGPAFEPAMVWTGSYFGLVWEENRDGDFDIFFARIDASGNRIGADVSLTDNVTGDYTPDLVWAGDGYGLAWTDSGLAAPVLVRLDPQGNMLGTPSAVFGPANSHPTLAWTGSEYGLIWHGNCIYFEHFDSSGNPITGGYGIIGGCDHANGSARGLSLVWSGSAYGISWSDRLHGNFEVYFNQFDSTGARLGPDKRVTVDPDFSEAFGLAWTGSEFGLAWADERHRPGVLGDVLFTRLRCCNDGDGDGHCREVSDPNDADPTVHDGAPETCDGQDNDGDAAVDEGCDSICDSPENAAAEVRETFDLAATRTPDLVRTADGYGVAWRDERDGNPEIYFALLDLAGVKVGTDVRVTNDPDSSTDPAVVWTGSGFGIVWTDDRDGNDEVYFAAVDAAGTKLGGDVRVTNDAASSRSPDVAWTGTEYGVAWSDSRDGNAEIYVVRLDASGAPVGAESRVTSDAAESAEPSLAWSGTEYGLAWHDRRDTAAEVYFARLSALGAKIGGDVPVTADDGADSTAPAVVWNGGGFGVAWTDARPAAAGVYLARLDAGGTVLGTETQVSGGAVPASAPSLAWTGGEYGVAWHDAGTGTEQVYFNRVDASGVAGAEQRLEADAARSTEPSLVWTGSAYAVTWVDERDGNGELYFVDLRCCDDHDLDGYTVCAGDTNDGDGAVFPGAAEICDGRDNDANGIPDDGCDRTCETPDTLGGEELIGDGPADAIRPSVAWSGLEYAVAWVDDRDGNDEIYFVRFDRLGHRPVPETRITNDASASSSPSLVWTGTEYGVAWIDQRGSVTGGQVYFARIDAAGAKIGADVPVTDAAVAPGSPRLVWNGSGYGVVWKDERGGDPGDLYFARLDPAGAKLGSDVRITDDAAISDEPSLAWNGTGYGVAWRDDRGGGAWEVYFARLDAGGAKLTADIPVSASPSVDSMTPALAWTGTDYGLAWVDRGSSPEEVVFAKLAASGALVSTTNLPPVTATVARLPGGTSLAWSGAEFGLTWSEQTVSDDPVLEDLFDTFFARIDATGNLIGGIEWVSQGPALHADQSPVTAVAWADGEYGVAWDDKSSPAEVRFARVGADGEVPDRGHPVTSDPGTSERSSLVWTGSGFGVAWQDDRHGDLEIYFLRLDPSGNPAGSETRVTDATWDSSNPSLAWTGSEYGIAWQDARTDTVDTVYFARVDASGAKIGSDVPVPTSGTHSTDPHVVWSGSEYAIVWVDSPDTVDSGIFFARLDAGGNRIGADLRVSQEFFPGNPSIAWNGGGYGVVWESGSELLFVALDPYGNKIGTETTISEVVQAPHEPCLVWNGGGYGLAWRESWFGTQSWEFFVRLDTSGTPIGTRTEVARLGTSPPTLVWTGDDYGIAFDDGPGPFFRRLTADGSPDVGGLVPFGQAQDGAVNPSLAWTGNDFGVTWDEAWQGSREILFDRIRCCADDRDVDGYAGCVDCDDRAPAYYPGATETCDGTDENCNGILDDGLSTDADADGHYAPGSCWSPSDDCDDTDPLAYPGAPETTCDGVDQGCDGAGNEAPDGDGDGYDVCGTGDPVNPDGLPADCSDSVADRYPGAPEINDCKDNQCPGDAGFGLFDEISGDAGFHNPSNRDEYSWPAQTGATDYRAVRSPNPEFVFSCATYKTTGTTWVDPAVPAPGLIFHYLVQPQLPCEGSFGADSAGVERTVPCL